jgi:hypothetical protein
MAKKRWITVEVTQDMIDRATPSDCYDCLVAIALNEATGWTWHVIEKSARIEVFCGPLGKMRPTWNFSPDRRVVRRLMSDFDAGEPVEPCTFRLPARYADKKWRAYGADW